MAEGVRVQSGQQQRASPQVVVLGAGRGVRGETPSALVLTDDRHRVLDWVLDSFSVIPEVEVLFVGGYRIADVAGHYPRIRFLFNPDWAETGSAQSLALVPPGGQGSTFVCYSDIVFRPKLVREIDAVRADLVLAVDTAWRTRYDGRSSEDLDLAEKIQLAGDRIVGIGRLVDTEDAFAEFLGLVKLSPAASRRVHKALEDGVFGRSAGLPDVIQHLVESGASLALVDAHGDWAELNAPQDLARFVLGTKAESLERLRPLVRKGRIGLQVSFSHSEWEQRPSELLEQIREVLGSGSLIVRSSALSEDGWLQSAAGAYKSLLDVPGDDEATLSHAVDEVFASYGERLGENQVLVQCTLKDVSMSGVVMTRTPTLGAPYFVINFDSTTGSTETVTDGTGDALRTVYVHRSSKHQLIEAAQEIEKLVGHDSLDIEFAFTRDASLRILQVRPIAVSHRQQPVDDEKVARGIERGRDYLRELQGPSPIALGRSTRLSVMTDWNPAEMIGTKPRRLAFSLYRRLITDEAWALQRMEYGYRDLRPCNLIVDVLGHPYIDVRVDFNSFVPAELDDELAERLVDHYLEHLGRHPELHDKVEFDVLLTCLAFDFDAQSERLREAGFTPVEIKTLRDSLERITQKGIARCTDDVAAIADLDERFRRVMSVPLPPLERAYMLLEDVRRLGIPLFSHLARHGFVAVTLLKSLRAAGCLSDEEVESFQSSLRTVPAVMQEHAFEVAKQELDWDAFVAEYGHLRPGSYDITSECYAHATSKYLLPMVEAAEQPAPRSEAPSWCEATRKSVDKALRETGFEIDCDELCRFMAQGIEGREFGKFSFMRGVSEALEAIAEFGALHGVSRESLAHIRVEELFTLRGAAAQDQRDTLAKLSERGKEEFYVSQAACLPGQIVSEEDLESFEQVAAEPNYITRNKVRARVYFLAECESPDEDLAGTIVVVANADPGYDWLFSREIAGLITMYGGVNSHMAIRAAEFGLPAAIGVGELLFESISRAEILELDCESRKIELVR